MFHSSIVYEPFPVSISIKLSVYIYVTLSCTYPLHLFHSQQITSSPRLLWSFYFLLTLLYISTVCKPYSFYLSLFSNALPFHDFTQYFYYSQTKHWTRHFLPSQFGHFPFFHYSYPFTYINSLTTVIFMSWYISSVMRSGLSRIISWYGFMIFSNTFSSSQTPSINSMFPLYT